MRKLSMLLTLGFVLGVVGLWTMPAFADSANTVFEHERLPADDVLGQDYTDTLPGEPDQDGGYIATNPYYGQSNALGNDVGNGGSVAGNQEEIPVYNGEGNKLGLNGALIPYLSQSTWYDPCPHRSVYPTGPVVAGPCDAQTNPTDPQTEDILGAANNMATSNPSEFVFQLYQEVAETWVDYAVPNISGTAGTEGPATWSGTLDQDMAQLFEYVNSAGTSNDSMANAQDLDQGLVYVKTFNLDPGSISSTDMHTLEGNAQRIVQSWAITEFPLTQNTDGDNTTTKLQQWVADWTRDVYTGNTGGAFSPGGSTFFEFESLLSSSFNDANPGGGGGLIHQVNDQFLHLAAVGSGSAVDVGPVSNSMIQWMSVEFWHEIEPAAVIPYELGPEIVTPAREIVDEIYNRGGADHNPLDNGTEVRYTPEFTP